MRQTVYDSFFIASLLAVLYGIVELLAPFAGAILAAVVSAICFYPLYESLRRRLPRWSSSVHAGLTDFLVFGVFITPLMLLSWCVIRESASLEPAFQQWRQALEQLRQGDMTGTLSWLRPLRLFLIRSVGMSSTEFRNTVIQRVNSLLASISVLGAELAKHSIALALDLMIMVFILFFLFRDGTKLVNYIQEFIPMRRESKLLVRRRLHSATVGLARGWLLTSIVQGITAMIVYFIVRTPGAVLLGVLTGLCGFIPVVGTSIIWLPVGGAFLLQGNYAKGLTVLGWGSIFVVGLIDSLLRPYLVGRHTHLPLYALFFALVGGVKVWGAKGLILGPLLVSIAPAFLDMCHERYLRERELAERCATPQHM